MLGHAKLGGHRGRNQQVAEKNQQVDVFRGAQVPRIHLLDGRQANLDQRGIPEVYSVRNQRHLQGQDDAKNMLRKSRPDQHEIRPAALQNRPPEKLRGVPASQQMMLSCPFS